MDITWWADFRLSIEEKYVWTVLYKPALTRLAQEVVLLQSVHRVRNLKKKKIIYALNVDSNINQRGNFNLLLTVRLIVCLFNCVSEPLMLSFFVFFFSYSF